MAEELQKGRGPEGCCRRRCARPDVSFSSSIHRLAYSMGTCLFTVLPPCSFCFSSSSFRALSLSSSSFFRASSSFFASSISYSGFLTHSFKLGSHRCLQHKLYGYSEFKAHPLRGNFSNTTELTLRSLSPPTPCFDTLPSIYCHMHMALSPRRLHTSSPS